MLLILALVAGWQWRVLSERRQHSGQRPGACRHWEQEQAPSCVSVVGCPFSKQKPKTLCLTVFEEPEDPSSRSFFSEIISSISDVKFSHSGRYMMTRDYLSVKVWDLNMESRPIETHQVRRCAGTRHPHAWRFLTALWSCSGPRVPSKQAVLSVRERLHLRQV